MNQLINYVKGDTIVKYSYGADGMRNYKKVSNDITYFCWNGSNLAAEENGSNINKYYYGIDGIAFANLNGTDNFYLKNIHGDIVGSVNTSGEIINNTNYDAFGNRLSAAPDPFGYCGEYMDSETGFIYLRNRYYDTATGAFISEDPIRDGLNWYGYCGGNPVNYIDPFGLFDNDTILNRGSSRTEDIKMLQEKLNSLGFTDNNGNTLAVDGSFGPSTQQAVNKYKDSKGLWNFGEYEGVVGLTTWRFLNLPVETDKLYPIYYSTTMVTPYELELSGYVLGEDFIIYETFGVSAITHESAESIKQFADEKINKIVSMCVASTNISGFTKHGLAQVMGRDGGRGVSNKALLDAVKSPQKIIEQAEGKIKYVGENATVILNELKKVITAWATNSNGVR